MRMPGNSAGMLTKTSTMSVRLTPKLRYLADLSAREHDTTLTGFIEQCIHQCLLSGSIDATALNGKFPQDRPPFHNEGLWSDDPAKRFFLLVTARPDLMNESERKLCRKILSTPELLNEDKSVNLFALSSKWSQLKER